MTSIAVVTPWHNAHELAPAYWNAMAYLGLADQVIVVDNASTPPLEHPKQAGVQIIRSATNQGFSKASNLGLDVADTDAVLFLNNDVRMTDTLWIERIRSHVETGVLVGAHLRDEPHAAVDGQPVPYLDGWCLAGMRADLEALGGWDDLEEPSYYGDNLLCARAVAAGMKLVQVDAGIEHLGNYTSRRYKGRDEVAARNRGRYETEVRNLRKPVGRVGAKVAVITAALPTRGHLLADAIASVATQTLPAHRHLVAVDLQREGSAAVRNQLAAAAYDCDWLAFLDDDDVLYPHHLERLVAAGEEHGADLVYPWCDVEGRSDGWNPSRSFDADALRQGNYVPITCLVRRRTFDRLGGFRPFEQWPPEMQTFDGGGFRGHEDWDLWIRMLDAGCSFVCVPERTWRYRLHAGSKTVVGERTAA